MAIIDEEQPGWKYLIDRYLSNSITKMELDRLLDMAETGERPEEMDAAFMAHWERVEAQKHAANRDWDAKLSTLLKRAPITPVHRVHFVKTAWFRYAAILVLIAATATYLYLANVPQRETARKQPTVTPDIAAGGNKAVLTLSDGRRIVLDSAANGALAEQGGTKIVKLNTGTLAYHAGTAAGKEMLYNTISTPNGGQYQIALPDGSRVWLNAASSITFPAAFPGKERHITVTGEVYFEIANDKNKAFSVAANGTDVKVLGTSFNINSYANEEAVKTTLLDGAIEISDQHSTVRVEPGTQAITYETTNARYKKIVTKPVNTEQVMAWKNGLFNAEGMDVAGLMRQIERWYNVGVVYEQGVPANVFAGNIPRGITLTHLMKILEDFGVRSRINTKERIITILP